MRCATRGTLARVGMWCVPLAFFAYQFILRLWPSLTMASIREHFSMDATAFGVLSSMYYYGYAGMQIPVAFWIEQYGLHIMLGVCATVCGMAFWCFNHTEHWGILLASRFALGAGSAMGFLGTSKAISMWFPPAYYTRLVGLSFSIGLMGAIYGGRPVSLWIQSAGVDAVVSALTAGVLILGALGFVCLRSAASETSSHEPVRWRDVRALLSQPVLWWLAVANLLMVGTLEGFSDIWGVSYIAQLYHLPEADAAAWVSLIFVGMLLGGPVLAYLSRWWDAYAVIVACGVGTCVAFALLLGGVLQPNFELCGVMGVLGILCCYQVLVFAVGAHWVTPQCVGVAIAFLNCINMLGGSFFHTAIGYMMDRGWTGTYTAEGIRQYVVPAYQHGLSVIPVCAGIGAWVVWRLKRHAKSLNSGSIAGYTE